MATSGSVDYTIDKNTLIKESLQLVQALGEGVEPTATQYADAGRTLNIMVKAWQAYGLQLWTITTGSIDLALSTASYTLGPNGTTGITERPLKLTNVYITDSSSNDTELFPLTRQEYVALSNKTTSGFPTQYYYDPQLTDGVLYIWPVPDSTTAAYTLKVKYQSPIEDMDSSTDDFDFPQEWYEAVKYGLAMRLALPYGMPYLERKTLKEDYLEILDLAKSWDTEQESVFLTVGGD